MENLVSEIVSKLDVGIVANVAIGVFLGLWAFGLYRTITRGLRKVVSGLPTFDNMRRRAYDLIDEIKRPAAINGRYYDPNEGI